MNNSSSLAQVMNYQLQAQAAPSFPGALLPPRLYRPRSSRTRYYQSALDIRYGSKGHRARLLLRVQLYAAPFFGLHQTITWPDLFTDEHYNGTEIQWYACSPRQYYRRLSGWKKYRKSKLICIHDEVRVTQKDLREMYSNHIGVI